MEWLACADPDRLPTGAPRSVTRRKWLLVACACARRAWRLVPVAPHDSLAVLESTAEPDGTPGEHGVTDRALIAVRLGLARAADALAGKNHRIADHTGALRSLVFGIVSAARIANAAART